MLTEDISGALLCIVKVASILFMAINDINNHGIKKPKLQIRKEEAQHKQGGHKVP